MTISNQKLNFSCPNLCNNQKCTGCLACYNVCRHDAIALKTNDEGFVYPEVQLDVCSGCKLCEKVCPIINKLFKNPVSNIAYAAWAKDKKILRNSSSGGIYSIISNYVFKNGGIVFGAAFDKDWNLQHIATSNETEFSKTRGSKYVQSYIGTTYRNVADLLSSGRMVLFSGTPCQISGLKSYLELTKCETKNLYTIDLVCHGVPSPMVFKSYLGYLDKKYQSSLIGFSCRDKQWSWHRFNFKATFKNGHKYYGKWEEDFFLRGFLREYFLRHSCHSCAFATEQRCGDFTLCDYWGYYRKQGEEDNKDWGVSLVIPNSVKAKKLYSCIIPNIVSYEREILEAMKCNQAFHSCFAASPIRDDFWKDFKENGFEKISTKYLYPEEIKPQFQKVYKYGRNGKKFVEALSRMETKMRRVLSRIKNFMINS